MLPLSGLYLCVDAGGTKTAVVVVDKQGVVLSRGKAGPANMTEVGLSTAVAAIVLAIDIAVALLPGGKEGRIRFDGAWIGISGCDTPDDVVKMRSSLAEMLPLCSMRIMNDALLLCSPLLLRPPQSKPWTLAVIAGTGSIVMALSVDRDGRANTVAKRGGYGHLFGDPGSAYHLGLTAIATVTETYDLGLEQPGGLAEAIRKEWGVLDTASLPGRAHDLPLDLPPVASSDYRKRRIASLSPIVLSLASTCPQAEMAVRRTARALAADIAIVVKQVGLEGYTTLPGMVVAGGLGTQSEYLNVVRDELSVLGVRPGWVETVVDVAELGARALAHTS